MNLFQQDKLMVNKKDLTGRRREVFLRNSTLYFIIKTFKIFKFLINHKILDCFKTPPYPPYIFGVGFGAKRITTEF